MSTSGRSLLGALPDILALLEQTYQLRRWLEAEARRVSGCTFSQYLALRAIQDSNGQRTVSRLAEDLGRTGQTTTSLTDSLERAGFVRRKRLRNGDRRQVWVTLTPRGKEMLQKTAAADPPLGAELIDQLVEGTDGHRRLRDAVALVEELMPEGA
jgi:DNA-binding MarR family transcriptional regulator